MFEFGEGPTTRSSIRSSRAEADVKYITRATLQGASELEGGNSGLPGKHKLADGKKNDDNSQVLGAFGTTGATLLSLGLKTKRCDKSTVSWLI